MGHNTLKILLSCSSSDGAERINKLFRNSGTAAQTHRITSIQDLDECLNDQVWDLALCEQKNDVIDMHEALKHIVNKQCGTPVILLTDEINNDLIIEGMSKGAQDVIQGSSNEHLLFAANREVENFGLRRQANDWQRCYEEISNRFDSLMANADDAIAYIFDGMHVDVNEAYAQLFELEDKDELLAIPITDLIAEEEQEEFKAFIRQYNSCQNQEKKAVDELSTKIALANGKSMDVEIKFVPAIFDDEQCTQLIVRRLNEQANVQLTADRDPMTGLYSRYHLVDKVDAFLNEDKNGCLLYIGINDFSKLKKRMRLSGGMAIRHQFAGILKETFSNEEALLLSHYGEDTFTVLMPDCNTDAAMKSARELCEKIENNFFEVENETAQVSCCVGVLDFSKSRFATSNKAMDAAFSALEEARQLFIEDNSAPGIILHRAGASDATEEKYNLDDLISSNRLRMMFQPIINLHGENFECYEATLRLYDIEGEELPIDAFIQTMNQKSGDTSLDKWLTLEGTKALIEQKAANKKTLLILNLTQNAFIDESYVNWLSVALKAARIDNESVILQFQENTVAHFLKQAVAFKEQLIKHNISFSISQFGRSPESFKVLQHFMSDFVITDGSFTHALQSDPTDLDKLKKVLTRLSNIKVKSIVPYVENAATLASLWQMNASYIQGYYLQAPGEKMDYEFADMN